ncbi:oxidoreductase, partial [Salmonella enterica]
FATMAGKRQMLCASTFKRFRQVRPGGGNRAFAVHPNGVGKLFRREKVGQSFEASCMGKIIRRAGNDAGQALQFEIFDDANFLVLVEPRIILQAPDDYLLAGIGDTLAKWYEAVVLAPQPETLPLTVRLGINSACAIRDLLLDSSEQALADKQQRRLTQAFCDVVDAIIAGGGMVGGLGERYTRVAAAHAVHNGLTVLPQTEKFLHGTKVAYGILVQSALLGQDDVLAQLITAYRRFHLPARLSELDVDIHNTAEIDRVIAHTLRPVESIHYLPVTLTPDTLRAAFEKVEFFRI